MPKYLPTQVAGNKNYKCTTERELAGGGQMLHVHSPGNSTFLAATLKL